ncbi:FAD/NAD(P)-binding protein [Streptomyces sp. NPDC055966]|uniref:FAD/NAD(P)-binding protein n=1 Tax=Streptomyces sp. NPDC055966 TaxID=3345669 RepID=UPI0035D7F0C4
MISASGSQPAGRIPSLVIVGAGPRSTGVVERIAANAPELLGPERLDLHIVDPYPPGGGRTWRHEQSPLLWMNSRAKDVTMYTDDSVTMEGPVRPGPTLAEWAALAAPPLSSPELTTEARELTAQSFASRRLQSAYLREVYARAIAALPPGITVHEHRATAVRLAGPRTGRQRVWLDGRADPLTADLVVIAVGHFASEPDDEQTTLAAFAARHGLVYLPPDFTSEADLSVLLPGTSVLVRGLGLAFTDLMVLLTEGRGGRYTDDGSGKLTYHPTGREPVLHVGSRRGVPYHAKIGYGMLGRPLPPPRYLGPAAIDELLRRPDRIDFSQDVRPLVAKELGFAHYHELFAAHPERTRLTWDAFDVKYAACAPGSAELRALVESSVPDPNDRLDLDTLDQPLVGVRFPDAQSLQRGLRAYIEADLARRDDPRHSPDLAVIRRLFPVHRQLRRLEGIGPWWYGFFSYLASGPPAPRLRQLLALSRAGVVRFLGAGTTIEADPVRGVFRAHSASLPGRVTEARTLVEARQPPPSVTRAREPLLRSLGAHARVTPRGLLVVAPADGRVLDRDGRPHPRRFALGPFTNARIPVGLPRPRANAASLRQNDATARAALTFLRALQP